MLHLSVGHYNQMYNMPEFNQINKEDTMSQGTKGSTKLMIAVWAIIMLFIGFKAFNASSDDSASNNSQIDSSTIERIKQIGEIRIDSNISVASSEISLFKEILSVFVVPFNTFWVIILATDTVDGQDSSFPLIVILPILFNTSNTFIANSITGSLVIRNFSTV